MDKCMDREEECENCECKGEGVEGEDEINIMI